MRLKKMHLKTHFKNPFRKCIKKMRFLNAFKMDLKMHFFKYILNAFKNGKFFPKGKTI
jgi:hypothetical protein